MSAEDFDDYADQIIDGIEKAHEHIFKVELHFAPVQVAAARKLIAKLVHPCGGRDGAIAYVTFCYEQEKSKEKWRKDTGIAGKTLDWRNVLRGDYLTDWRADLNRKGKPQPRVMPDATPEEKTDDGPRLTDLGNAQRLVAQHGEDLRYCYENGDWNCWDGTRFAVDRTGEVERRAKKTVKALYVEAAGASDPEHARKIALWAARSESKSALSAMVSVARSEPGVPVLLRDLDADPFLLNVANGTIDLRTGKLRPHDRADLITRLIPHAYDPDAKCPRWTAFLREAHEDEERIAFLQRWAGYGCTGDISEQKFVIHVGELGGEGKSTFARAVKKVQGEYGCSAPIELLLTTSNERHPTERADLQGRRSVTFAEVPDGRAFNEQRVKSLTGTGRRELRSAAPAPDHDHQRPDDDSSLAHAAPPKRRMMRSPALVVEAPRRGIARVFIPLPYPAAMESLGGVRGSGPPERPERCRAFMEEQLASLNCLAQPPSLAPLSRWEVSMAALPSQCPLCSSFDDPATYRQWFRSEDKRSSRDTFEINCHRCGMFEIGRDIADDKDGKELLARLGLQLSAAAREATDAGRSLIIGYDNVESLAAQFVPPRDRFVYFDRILQQLVNAQPIPGLGTPQLQRVVIAARVMLPDEAVNGVLQHLQEMSLIKILERDAIRLRTQLTPEGWKRVDEYRKGGGRGERVFVAMWFDDSMKDAYEKGIVPALTASGYERPFRVDDPEHDTDAQIGTYIPRIDDRILAGIRRSRFVVVDVTAHRPAVYYEAGFAEALEIPIIWCCRAEKDDVAGMSFDTRQNEHIIWKDPEDLRTKLEAKIARRGWKR